MALPYGELRLEVAEGIEPVRSIKFLIVLTVAAFHFSVVSWCEGPDELMLNAESCKCLFK